MKSGDLVKTTRAAIGFPVGSLGLILRERESRVDDGDGTPEGRDVWKVYEVAMVGRQVRRRWVSTDIEVVNGNL